MMQIQVFKQSSIQGGILRVLGISKMALFSLRSLSSDVFTPRVAWLNLQS